MQEKVRACIRQSTPHSCGGGLPDRRFGVRLRRWRYGEQRRARGQTGRCRHQRGDHSALGRPIEGPNRPRARRLGREGGVSSWPSQPAAGFGEGSLWATAFEPGGCRRRRGDRAGCRSQRLRERLCLSQGFSEVACAAGPAKTLLKRVDPRTGEVGKEIPLKGLNDAFSAGSVRGGLRVGLLRHTTDGTSSQEGAGRRRVQGRPAHEPGRGQDTRGPPFRLGFRARFGVGNECGYGTVSRIDPQSGEVVAKIEVGRGAVDIAADESSGAVWVASGHLPKDYGGYDNPKYSEDRNLTRVDPDDEPRGGGDPDRGALTVRRRGE